MSASTNSTPAEQGYVLISELWSRIDVLTTKIQRDAHGQARLNTYEARLTKETMVFAAHRLAFLEMVVKGMAYMEQHDFKAYAKFVEKKRKIEDLELEELKVLLR